MIKQTYKVTKYAPFLLKNSTQGYYIWLYSRRAMVYTGGLVFNAVGLGKAKAESLNCGEI